MLRILPIFWSHFSMFEFVAYIMSTVIFGQQLCWFHHLVLQSLLIRHMTLFIRMSLSGTLCFIISHLLLPVNFMILLHHHQFCYLIGLSQSCRHSILALIWSIKYQLLHSSSPSKVYPFHLYSISSRTLEHQFPTFQAKMISFPHQSLRYSQLCVASQKVYVLYIKG